MPCEENYWIWTCDCGRHWRHSPPDHGGEANTLCPACGLIVTLTPPDVNRPLTLEQEEATRIAMAPLMLGR